MNENLKKILKERVELMNECLSTVVNEIAIYDGMSMSDKVTLAGILFQEACKDERQAKIQQRIDSKQEQKSEPATEKQRKYLEYLGVEVKEGLTKEEASRLIEEAKKKEVSS